MSIVTFSATPMTKKRRIELAKWGIENLQNLLDFTSADFVGIKPFGMNSADLEFWSKLSDEQNLLFVCQNIIDHGGEMNPSQHYEEVIE